MKKHLEAKPTAEVLKWIRKNAKYKRTHGGNLAWLALPGKPYRRIVEIARSISTSRFPKSRRAETRRHCDVFEWLDLDDYVSFGGKG